MPRARPDVSIVVPTYNRAPTLARALGAALGQEPGGPAFEVIVVDNNSTDDTQHVVADAVGRGGRPRYVFEPRQGVAHARNAGVASALAPIVAFCDDDVLVAPNWVATIAHHLAERPDAACIGGKVLAAFETAPPPWLTRDHWPPLALQDFGDTPFTLDASNETGLVAANLAFRRSALEQLGGFPPRLQRTPDAFSAMEDRELLMRLRETGGVGLYAPDLVVTALVPTDRLTKAYHRRWHREHGACFARLNDRAVERSRVGRFLGVPAHLYRRAAGDAVAWARGAASGDGDAAFVSELRLRFFAGFFGRRFRDWRAGGLPPATA